MGGTALIAASKYVHVCVREEGKEGEGGVHVCVWVGVTVWMWV